MSRLHAQDKEPVARRGLNLLREALHRSLPYVGILSLGVAAALSWWWLRSLDVPPPAAGSRAARTAPDYAMEGFLLQSFGVDGFLLAEVKGQRLLHYPQTDELEVHEGRMTGWARDGHRLLAQATQVTAQGDGSRWTLAGKARVERQWLPGAATQPALILEGEALSVEPAKGWVTASGPVSLRQGATRMEAGRLDYDDQHKELKLSGGVRAQFAAGPIRKDAN